MNRIGLHIGYWWGTGIEQDLFQMLALTHRAELDIIEINPAWLLQLSSEECKRFAERLQEYGMTATLNGGLDAAHDIASDTAEARKAGVLYCKEVLRKMPALNISVWSGCNYSEWLRCPASKGDAQEEKKRALEFCVESMQEIIKTAEECGVDYCFEVLNRFEQFLFNTAEEAVAFSERIGSPRAKILLDTYHMNIEENAIAPAVAYAAAHGKLGHLHVGESNRRVPGVGMTDMDWDGIASAVNAAGYQGAMVMEPFVLVTAHNAKRTHVWRDLSDGADINRLVQDARTGGHFLRGKLDKNI